ncbi:MAG: hypothetical protein ACODAJ_04535 [Planctomycetota bacterium]
MNRNHLLSLAAGLVVAGLLLLLLSLGSGSREPERPDPLLLDVRLERLVRVGPATGGELPDQPTLMEVVCRLRFLAREGAPTSVVLPSGGRSGYALAFVPRLRRRRGEIEFRAEDLSAELTIHWRDELEGAPRDDVWLYPTHESRTLVAKVAEGIVIEAPPSDRAAEHRRAELRYRVILQCNGPVAEARLDHVSWSIYALDGEELHLTNTAVPALMTAGVTIEDPTPVLDQP